LGRFAKRTFLDLWSVPTPYIKKGHALHGGDGDELCDLIVVFGNDVVLFSDKRCVFGGVSDTQTSWNRWVRRAIHKSARQLGGALKNISRYRDQLYEDPSCTVRIRLDFPAEDDMRVHLIAVANGIREACIQHYGDGSGSLPFYSDHPIELISSDSLPFVLGPVEIDGCFVHVLDEASIEFVMGHLDTASDFMAYLMAREKFLSDKSFNKAITGEEDLLALYLYKGRPTSRRWGFDSSLTGIGIDESWSASLAEDANYKAGRKANAVSYAWDRIIDYVSDEFGVIGSEESEYRRGGEVALRCMATSNRHERRFLASALVDAQEQAVSGSLIRRFVRAPTQERTAFLIVVAPKGEMEMEQYRQWRREHIEDVTVIACAVFREHVDTVVGIATEPINDQGYTFDLAYHREPAWTDARLAEIETVRKELGVWKRENFRVNRIMSNEFPDVANGEYALKLGVAKAESECPCGSGKAVRDCCGKPVD